MITISPQTEVRKASTISFASTLYLCPVLDLLLAQVPSEWRSELRLGLQEALVNAAKHGNKLDPSKQVVVHFCITKDAYRWAIADQGSGFTSSQNCCCSDETLPPNASECGRGLFLLHQIFDEVNWNRNGREVVLTKKFKNRSRLPWDAWNSL